MRQRIKPHPAVALILQHLRSEARTFDVVAAVGEKRDFTWRQREMERWQNVHFTFNQSRCKLGRCGLVCGELVLTFLSVFTHVKPARFMASSHWQSSVRECWLGRIWSSKTWSQQQYIKTTAVMSLFGSVGLECYTKNLYTGWALVCVMNLYLMEQSSVLLNIN